jgi:hypothetical protein
VKRRRSPRTVTLAVLGVAAACAKPITVLAPSHALACPASTVRLPLRTGAFLGDSARSGPAMQRAIVAYRERAGAPPGFVKLYTSLEDRLDPASGVGAALRAVVAAGAMPVLTVEPTWRSRPPNLLAAIAHGDANGLIRAWADALRRTIGRDTIIIELAPEMNGRFGAPWQPSGRSVALDSVVWRDYAAAWRRIVEVVRAAGNDGVRWLWSPSAGNPYTHRETGGTHWNWMDRYYPGDDVVDYVGLHAFNDPESQRAWVPFVELADGDAADRSLSALVARHARKPIVLSELATSELPGDPQAKAAWIRDAFSAMRGCSSIAGVVWFDAKKERDWRIDSSPAALVAFRAAIRP